MSKPQLLFLPPDNEQTRQLFTAEHIEALSKLVHIEKNPYDHQIKTDELFNMIPYYDIVITGWQSPCFTPEIIDQAKRLKMICHSTGTVQPYVLQAVFNSNIIVTSSNNIMSKVTAEAGMAMMMMGAWEIKYWIKKMEKGGWKTKFTTVPGVQGNVLGIIGLGSITRHMLSMLGPFDFKQILIHTRHACFEEISGLGCVKTGLEELLVKSDIIMLQTSLTEKTKGMLNHRRLSLIKPDALFINIGRGELVDEIALTDCLCQGKFRAVLDVYTQEPLASDSLLRTLPNVICLPHLGAATRYCRRQMGWDVIVNIQEFLDGKEPHGKVIADSVINMSKH